MTSRRSIQQYEQRISRMLQFVPGHVGGRVSSAQPVERRDGTIRRGHAVGAAGVPAPPVSGIAYDSADVLWDDATVIYDSP